MKKITKLIHGLSMKLNLDTIASNACSWLPIARKLVPEPWEYPNGTIKRVARRDMVFDLNVSDYMQWVEYAQLPDNSTAYIVDLLRTNPYPKTVIDVGANIGSFSIKLAYGLKDAPTPYSILSVEPNPETYKLLVHNVSLNKSISQHLHCLERAVGDTNNLVELDVNTSNSGNSMIISSIMKQQNTNKNSLTVPQITVDSLLLEFNLKSIDCIKVDVEGYEPFVIDGAKDSIDTFNPVLYIEVTPKWFAERGRSWNNIYTFLLSRGYRIFCDKGRYLHEILSSDSISDFQYNVLAVPKKYSVDKIKRHIK